jgi:ABC-type sugar transport system ATPase subunit
MNMIKGKLTQDGAALESTVGYLPLPRTLGLADAGEAAVLGIRPSDIRFASGDENGLAASIAMLEPLGDITIVSLDAGGETLRMVLPESVASSLRPGQPVPVVLDPTKFHVFRASSGQAIG